MSFYGNVATTNQSQFTFDKTYPNRYTMEQNISLDGIYIGRYVLVEYNVDNSSNLLTVFRGSESLDPQKGEVFYLYSAAGGAISTRLQYTTKKNPSDPSKGEGEGNVIEKQNVIVYTTINNNTTATFYQCIGYKAVDGVNYATFKKILDGASSSDYYIQNYTIDLNHYSNVGRSGYDSTVWQKILQGGIEKYVMIAELNSVVPSFDIQVDGPTESPLPPHFDTTSTSVNYKLHIQPSWGFRIKKATDSSKSDQVVSHKRWVYNQSDTIGSISTSINAPGDIYYNAAGFNEYNRVYAGDAENYISISPGQSGSSYYNHNTKKIQKMDDVQELSIHLPVIGNIICTLWDIIHGENRDDGEGSLMYIISQAQSSVDEINDLKQKITVLEEKAKVWDTAEANVQSNWSETNTNSDSYIQNKPTNLITSEDLDITELENRINGLEGRIAALEGPATT